MRRRGIERLSELILRGLAGGQIEPGGHAARTEPDSLYDGLLSTSRESRGVIGQLAE